MHKGGTLLNWKKHLKTCTILTGLTVASMHIVNRFVYYMSTIDNLLSDDNTEYYDWRFGRICYQKAGSGSPILLIHDLNSCSSSSEWNQIVDSLAKTNTVYTIDLLGCGQSDKPNLTYTNYLYVQLVTDFIKHIIGEKTDIIAMGDSGSFVLMACANDHSIINKVLLINPGDLIELSKIPTKRTKLKQHLINMPIIGTFLYNLHYNKRTIEKELTLNGYYDPQKVNRDLIKIYFESAHRDNTAGKYLFSSIKSRFTNANVVYSLSRINNSVFIIVGNANPEYALIASQYQNYMPSIEIQGIDQTKRYPHLENPKAFLEQVEILFDLNNDEELSTK